MATIVVSTQANGVPNPGSAVMALGQNSELFVVVRKSGGELGLFNSANNGATWTDTGVSISRANLQEWSDIDVDEDNHIHISYRVYESGKDRVFYRRWRRSGTTFVLESEVLVREATAASSGAVYAGLDVLHLRIADDHWHVVVASGITSAPTIGTILTGVVVKKSGSSWSTTISSGTVFSGNRLFTHTGTGKVQPSLQRAATPTPHLFLTYGRSGVYTVRLSWNASTKRWVGPTGDKLIGSNTTASDYAIVRHDGTRLLIPILNGSAVTVSERNTSNTTQVDRTSPAHTAGVVRRVAIVSDSATGNFRLFAIGTSSGLVYYVDYTRASNTWGTWVSTGITPVNIDCWGVRSKRTVHSDTTAGYDFYYGTTTGGNTYAHTRYTVSYPPSTPTWAAGASAQNNGVAAASSTLLLNWDFNDTDPADTQTAYALSRQIGAGTIQYWRASDNTWQLAEVKNVSPVSQVTLPAPWGVESDPASTFKVKVWDSADLASVYSAGVSVVPSIQYNPTITSPVDESTYIFRYLTVNWTVGEQSAYRIHVYPNGVFDPNQRVYDSGWVAGTDTTHTTPAIFADNTNYDIFVNTLNNEGLEGGSSRVDIFVDFVTPPLPTLVVTANNAAGTIDVQINNPAPTGSEPALLGNDLYRREVGDTSDGIRVATGLADDALFEDFEAASGVDYEYRVKAIGINETEIYSVWTD